ncbi:hypothetical protein GPECTOR_3g353 [Gonium pectorale]|uniref:RNase III domain-containing protein n=1 Tax=Gonium pectorale TaxID=33097 RepID=A0A150H0W9_GONPE|nr:hypothetical protein GPECTOR_3g353 [Gonium pectorale]|eukprot:KXZ55210.1 hypothetical protein GPECTOR_3g353 [Gonium pectorale]
MRQLREVDALELLQQGNPQFPWDLRPRDLGVYQRAFVHSSFCLRNHEQWLRTHQRGLNQPPESGWVPLQPESNLMLEWLGDSVLQLLVTDLLLERHPGQTEDCTIGKLSSMRASIVCNESLGRLMLNMGWHKKLLIDANLERAGGRTNKELLANCFEALVGAVYTDLGHAACRWWLAALLGECLGPVPGATASAVPAAVGPGLPPQGPPAIVQQQPQQQQDRALTQQQGKVEAAISFDAVVNRFSDGAELSWLVPYSSTHATLRNPAKDRDAPQRKLTQQHLQALIVRPEQVKVLHIPTGTLTRSTVTPPPGGLLTVSHLMDTVSAWYSANPGREYTLRSRGVDPYDLITGAETGSHNLIFKCLTPCGPGEAYVTTWDQ